MTLWRDAAIRDPEMTADAIGAFFRGGTDEEARAGGLIVAEVLLLIRAALKVEG